MARVLITGSNGVVGYPLTERLERDQCAYYCVSRQPDATIKNTVQWDLQQAPSGQTLKQLKAANLDTLVHCAPIWLLADNLEVLASLGIGRIVAFSSSSVTSKQNSKDRSENVLVQQLADAEEALKQFCLQHAISFTILRPSMIYGYGRDQNITHIVKFIKRYGFMLLVGKATGLRQPVHADDLVDASISVLNATASHGKTYHLAGAQVLTYRAMVEALFVGLNKRPRIISLPLWLFRLVLKTAAVFGRFSYTAEMADRMSQHLNYDNSAALQDFAYTPQTFLVDPERDLLA